MSLIEFEIERQSNPVDMIEIVAASNDWSFERSGEDEIAMTVAGHWARLSRFICMDGIFRSAASCLRLRHQGAGPPCQRSHLPAVAGHGQVLMGHSTCGVRKTS